MNEPEPTPQLSPKLTPTQQRELRHLRIWKRTSVSGSGPRFRRVLANYRRLEELALVRITDHGTYFVAELIEVPNP